jgi:hypothetical protein
MVYVPTAPSATSDDHSGMERDDIKEEQHKGKECNKYSDSNATINIDFQKAVLKIRTTKTEKNSLTTQYIRVLKQRDDKNVQKHAQVLKQARRWVFNGMKTQHKTELSDLKGNYK